MQTMSGRLKPSFDLNGALETDIETIQILDVGAMLEGEAPYASLLEKGLAEVIGFEPNPTELARLRQEGAANCEIPLRLHPSVQGFVIDEFLEIGGGSE